MIYLQRSVTWTAASTAIVREENVLVYKVGQEPSATSGSVINDAMTMDSAGMARVSVYRAGMESIAH